MGTGDPPIRPKPQAQALRRSATQIWGVDAAALSSRPASKDTTTSSQPYVPLMVAPEADSPSNLKGFISDAESCPSSPSHSPPVPAPNSPSCCCPRARLRRGSTASLGSLRSEAVTAPTAAFTEWYLRHVLVPDRGTRAFQWVLAWELLITVLLVICAFTIPFSLACPSVASLTLSYFNKVIDCAYTADIVIHFFTAYRLHPESSSGIIWVKDPYKIALNYVGYPFWFWIDLLGVLPGWVDMLAGGHHATERRMLRIFRLVRLFRLTNLKQRMQELQARAGLPLIASDIIVSIFISTFLCHVAACFWVMIETRVTDPLFTDPLPGESWLSALLAAKGESTCVPEAKENPLCIYVLALYWSAMTLTTVGYGDITPQNQVEYMACTVYFLLAGFVWAYIVGSVVSLLSDLDPHDKEFKRSMDDMNAFMAVRNLPSELRMKMREYMLYDKGVGKFRKDRLLLQRTLSHSLEGEVALQTPLTKILQTKVYWATDMDRDALLQVVRGLKLETYGKDESIPMKSCMTIVREGLVAMNGRIYGRNEVIGQKEILITSVHLMEEGIPRTLSFVYIMVLTRDVLTKVCLMYPSFDHRLRRAQVKAALWRGFIQEAKNIKTLERVQREEEDYACNSMTMRSSSRRRTTFSNQVDPTQPTLTPAPSAEFASPSVSPSRLTQVESTLLTGQHELKDMLRQVTAELAELKAGRMEEGSSPLSSSWGLSAMRQNLQQNLGFRR